MILEGSDGETSGEAAQTKPSDVDAVETPGDGTAGDADKPKLGVDSGSGSPGGGGSKYSAGDEAQPGVLEEVSPEVPVG